MTADPTQAMRRCLADDLTRRGIIGPEWRVAVERVPRHLLVPVFRHRQDGEDGRDSFLLVDGSRPEQRERYLELVHSADETLVTEVDGDTGYPTSSSTMPSIVLAMLHALDVRPGQTVLEIGTGSGYSTALLCERLGEEHVTSVDVGPDVVELARRRLGAAGYRPALVCGDGFHGHPPRAPYDRVISTCKAVWMRGHSPDRGPVDHLVHGDGPARPCEVDMWTLLEGRTNGAFRPLAQLIHAPFLQRVRPAPRQLAYVAMGDRSWCRLDIDAGHVTQGGPRCLWDGFEALYHRLDEAGRPSRERFGMTVHPDGSSVIWLDHPEPGHAWAVLEPGT